MAEKSHNGEKHRLTDEQLRQLAEMTFQNAERIEQLTDLIYQLAIEAYNHGQPVKEIKEIQSAVQARKVVSEIQNMQLQQQRKSFGLD
ncbi:MAG: hypothetical protein ABSA47_09510 [Verrucomicrobiota bacterium]|jgi:DNA-binding ferritin-like protein